MTVLNVHSTLSWQSTRPHVVDRGYLSMRSWERGRLVIMYIFICQINIRFGLKQFNTNKLAIRHKRLIPKPWPLTIGCKVFGGERDTFLVRQTYFINFKKEYGMCILIATKGYFFPHPNSYLLNYTLANQRNIIVLYVTKSRLKRFLVYQPCTGTFQHPIPMFVIFLNLF